MCLIWGTEWDGFMKVHSVVMTPFVLLSVDVSVYIVFADCECIMFEQQ